MKTAACGPVNPQLITKDNTTFVPKKHKHSRVLCYTPRKCEFCNKSITHHDKEEAPYADGRYLCSICRADPDPFPSRPEEGAA